MHFTGLRPDHPVERPYRGVPLTTPPAPKRRVSLMHPLPEAWVSPLLSVLRMVTAFLFLAHGTQKLFGFPAARSQAAVDLASLAGVAGMLELVGGTLLLIGLFSRPVAFLLSGEMAVAYFLRHAPNGFWPMLNGGELAVLYCFLFLFISAAGPGVWSVDAMMRRSSSYRWTHPYDQPDGRRRWVA